MFTLNILFVVLLLRKRAKDKKFQILIVYGIAALTQDIISFVGTIIDYISVDVYEFSYKLDKINSIIFIQIEFYIFSRFFYHQFENKPLQGTINNISKAFIIIFAIASLIVITKPITVLTTFMSCLSVLSSILILTPSFYYFYILFSDPPVKNLLAEPSFWITNGIAFLHCLNIPLFLINGYLQNHHAAIWIDIYTINFVAYCFMFILFIIAILCQNFRETNLPHPTPTTQKH